MARSPRVSPPTDKDLRQLLARTRTIAVLGAHVDPSKPAHYVPDYLHHAGYDIFPVNPVFVGRALWGRPFTATVAELAPLAVEMVDVFRRPEFLMDHLADILAASPRVVWLQLGIRHAEFARILRDAGITVIEDRCTLAEHRRLDIARIRP